MTLDSSKLIADMAKLVSEYKNKTGEEVFVTVRLDGIQFRFDKIGFSIVHESDCVKSGDYFFVRDDGFVQRREMDSFRMTSS